MPSRTLVLATDLHARPAREVADAVDSFDASATLVQDDAEARASSPLELTALGAERGDEIVVSVDGPDAQEALDAIAGVLAEQASAARKRGDAGGKGR